MISKHGRVEWKNEATVQHFEDSFDIANSNPWTVVVILDILGNGIRGEHQRTVSRRLLFRNENPRERERVHRCKYDKSTEGVSDLDVRRRQRPISRGRNVINARDQTEATSCLTYSPLAVPRREPRLKACWIDILITILDSGEWRESF